MTRRFFGVCMLFVAVAALFSATAGGQEEAGAPTVEAARQVTNENDPARLYVTPVVAVHPGDPQIVAVGVGDARNGQCGVRISRDGGLSWASTANVMPAATPFCVQRNFGTVMGMAFASDGTLHLALSGSSVQTGHPNGPITAIAARSADLGMTWQTTVVAEPKPFRSTSGATPIEGFEQHGVMTLAVDPTDPNQVYMGWRFRGVNQETGAAVPPERPYIAVSRDGGRSWGPFTDLTPQLDGGKAFGGATPTPAVAPDGTVYAFIRERPAAVPAGQPRPPQRYFMVKSGDKGRTWAGSTVYPGQIFIYQPIPVIDTSGTIHLIFWQAEGSTLDVPTQIRYMKSSDGGDTWSQPRELTDDDPAGKFNQYWPGISVAPNGRLDVAWHDFRDDPYYVPQGTGPMGLGSTSQQFSNIYYTYSDDGGETWSANIRVTDRSIYRKVGVTFNNQDIVGPVGLASTDESALVTWSDSRGSAPFDAEDAYFTRLRFATAEAASEGDGSSPWAWAIAGAGGALALGGVVLVVATRTSLRPKGGAAPVSG